MAMKFPHVQTGERVVNPAALENAKRDLVNRFGDVGVGAIGSGFRNAPQWIPCYNAGSTAIQAGRAVNIKWDASGEDATAAIQAGLICVKLFDTQERQIGVVRDDIEAGGTGMVAFTGIVEASFSSQPPSKGERVWPRQASGTLYDGLFFRCLYGFPRLTRGNSGYYINLSDCNLNEDWLLVYAKEAISVSGGTYKGNFCFTDGEKNSRGAYPVKGGARTHLDGTREMYLASYTGSLPAGAEFFMKCQGADEKYLSGGSASDMGAYLGSSIGGRSVHGTRRIVWQSGSGQTVLTVPCEDAYARTHRDAVRSSWLFNYPHSGKVSFKMTFLYKYLRYYSGLSYEATDCYSGAFYMDFEDAQICAWVLFNNDNTVSDCGINKKTDVPSGAKYEVIGEVKVDADNFNDVWVWTKDAPAYIPYRDF